MWANEQTSPVPSAKLFKIGGPAAHFALNKVSDVDVVDLRCRRGGSGIGDPSGLGDASQRGPGRSRREGSRRPGNRALCAGRGVREPDAPFVDVMKVLPISQDLGPPFLQLAGALVGTNQWKTA